MESTKGMAATFFTQSFPIEGNVVYNVSWQVQTSDLVATTAALSGGIYVQFFDSDHPPSGTGESSYGDGWFPGYGAHELENTGGWVSRAMLFSPPSTAKYAMVHLAFGAHTTSYTPDRIHGGSAHGKVQMRNVKVVKTSATNTAPPVQVRVPAEEKNLTDAIAMVNNCFHDSSLTGNFTVGSDYIISGNLSPDLGMGLFGARRMGSKAQMDLYTTQWKFETVNGDPKTGEIHQRVMAQSWWPLGVDNIFSYSGNESYLAEQLPIVDMSLEWTASRYDTDGLFLCHAEPAHGSEGSDCGGPGMDWVDWSVSR
jgi:hypothetical protein